MVTTTWGIGVVIATRGMKVKTTTKRMEGSHNNQGGWEVRATYHIERSENPNPGMCITLLALP